MDRRRRPVGRRADSSTFGYEARLRRLRAARVAAEAVGAKLVSYTGLRGSYDFLAVFEGTFAQGAGVKMATEASGSLCDITVCEAININEVAENAAKIAGAYKGPGK